MTIGELKPLLDRTATLRMTDGEIARVRVRFVDEEYEDIIVDVLETSRPERYKVRPAAYTFSAADIVSALSEPYSSVNGHTTRTPRTAR